jgi:hypothetical protein
LSCRETNGLGAHAVSQGITQMRQQNISNIKIGRGIVKEAASGTPYAIARTVRRCVL